jgi:hypothetical protein
MLKQLLNFNREERKGGRKWERIIKDNKHNTARNNRACH